MPETQELYLRYEHGGHRVVVTTTRRSRKISVYDEASTTSYTSWGDLLQSLYGRKRHISFDWYFRLGRFSLRTERPARSVLDFLRPGVDLEERGHEVEKLLNSSFGNKLELWGLDREEVLQEIMKGILSRNKGPGAWNPDRGAFSTYVTLVCRSVILNMKKRKKRRDQHEQIGLYEVQGGAYVAVPVTQSRSVGYKDQTVELDEVMRDLCHWIDWTVDEPEPLTDLAQDILPLVYQGMRRGEIAEELNLPPTRVGQALRVIREAATSWREAQVM